MRKSLGYWGQRARGRALCRTNAMKEARRAKAALSRGGDRYAGEFFPYRAEQMAEFKRLVASNVRRARAANRDWRAYRARMKAETAEREREAW